MAEAPVESDSAVELDLVPLIGIWTAEDLWQGTNALLVSWILLLVLPRWKWTPTLTLISPLIHSAIYTISILTLITSSPNDESADFLTLQGVVKMFQNPNVVYIGWVHYMAFDFLVARAMLMDALERGISNAFYVLVMVPILCVTLYAGPVGFLMYSTVRPFARPKLDKESVPQTTNKPRGKGKKAGKSN